LQKLTYAERGRYLDKDRWLLSEVQTSEISAQGVTREQTDESIWTSVIDSEVVDVVVVDPENMSLMDLSKYIDFLQENKQDSAKYEFVKIKAFNSATHTKSGVVFRCTGKCQTPMQAEAKNFILQINFLP
jgi:lipopolysaccharide export LptBFGC system permease protein LptF